MNRDSMRRRLEEIAAATVSAQNVKPAGWWIGDNAGERRVKDDMKAGRLAWNTAHRDAKSGLLALDANDLEMAEVYLWSATDFLLSALWSRIEPADIEFLSNSAKPRGRRKKSEDRNARIADAVAGQEAAGLRGRAAIKAALRSDPQLKEALGAAPLGTIQRAIRRGKRPKLAQSADRK